MELKINYQYTYFVHPFIIKDGKYHKYLLKMLKDKDFKLKVFQKERDYTMYKYFFPNNPFNKLLFPVLKRPTNGLVTLKSSILSI